MEKIKLNYKRIINGKLNISQRIVAVALAVTILVSVICSALIFADDISGVNFPALKGYSEGTVPSASANWLYGIKDFGDKAEFQFSTEGFDAPVAEWFADDCYANISWNAYIGAAEYTLNVYDSEGFLTARNTSDTELLKIYTVFNGGKTYDLQVLALNSEGSVIAASAVRTFTAKQAPIVTPNKISMANNSNLNFSSSSLDASGNLVITTSSEKSNASIRLRPGNISDNSAKALVLHIKSEKEMLASFTVGFGTGNTYSAAQKTIPANKDAKSGASDTVYYVSAENPNNYLTASVNTVAINPEIDGYGDYSNAGYYLIIPLSLYKSDIVSAIGNGSYNFIRVYINEIRYKDTVNGGYAENSGNFDGSDITFGGISLISDIDTYLYQLKQEYNKVNDTATYSRLLEEKTGNKAYKYKGANEEILIADKFSGGYLNNKYSNAAYILKNNKSSRKIIFKSTSLGSSAHGSHLAFVAPQDGIYDFAGSIYVTGNKDVTDAIVYYRLVKVDNKNNQEVISTDSDTGWQTAVITEQELNPKFEFPVVQEDLKKGESVAIQVYHTSDSNSILNISFDNPTATVVATEESYKGSTTTYSFEDYAVGAVFDDQGTENEVFSDIRGRWYSKALYYNGGNTEYYDYNWMRDNGVVYKSGITGIAPGYFWKNGNNKNNILVGSNYGASFTFTSPKESYATISVGIANNFQTSGTYYRILKNDTKIYPLNTAWEEIPTGGAALSASSKVDAGDRLSIEFYSEDTNKPTIYVSTPISVTLMDNNSNSANSDAFSPLWERPYKGESYKGDFEVPPGAVWDFDLYKVSDSTFVNTDYYDTSSDILYKKGISDCGYIFSNEELKFRFANGEYGMSLKFTVPQRGYYDLSLALKTLKGNGEIFAKLIINGKTSFPESGDWYSYTGNEGKFDALEFSADSGDVIELRIYSVADVESEEMVIGLGTPIIKKLNNRIFTPTGNTTVYRPTDYIAFENGYNGKYIQLNSRFIYLFGEDSKSPVTTDSDKKMLVCDKGNVSFTENGKTVISAISGAAEIIFNSPMKGSGTVELITDELPSGANIGVFKNSEKLYEFTTALNQTIDINLDKNDKLIIKVDGLNGKNAVFSTINISLTGQHNNSNSAEDDGFYAVFANPYGDGYYVGDYEKTDASYWNFDFYKVKDNKIINADKYSGDEKKLYSSELPTAYYFGTHNLTGDMFIGSEDENYGLSLGFTAPRDDTFNVRHGLNLSGLDKNQSTATINARMIKIPANGGEITKIWPAENEWYTQEVEVNKDVKIPYAQVDLRTGDTVYLQVYASKCSGNVKINFVSPAFLKESVVGIINDDISAKIYRAYDYCPYSYIQDYKGTYIHMDNRWNFYFSDVDTKNQEFELKEAAVINTALANSDQMYRDKNYREPLFKWNPNSKAVDVVSEVTNDLNTGTVMQFTAPITGEISFSAPISISNILIDNAKLMYRVVSKNSNNENVKTIWPANNDSQWETLSKDSILSQCLDIKLDVNIGDVLEMQAYWIADSGDIEHYEKEFGKKWQPSYSVSPMVIVVDEINSNRTAYNACEQFVGEYLINPFWRVQYSMNSNDPVWKNATVYKWKNWLAASPSNIGISNASLYWIQNNSGFPDDAYPSVAWTFTSRKEGTFKYSASASMYIGKKTTEGYNAQARITLNGETVWPSNGWHTLTAGERLKIKNLSFDIAEGDIVRFEARADKKLNVGEDMYLMWNPTFSISDEIDIYNRSNDIYNLLDAQMLALFKKLESGEQFDPDLEANKILSAQRQEEKDNIVKFEYFTEDVKTEITDDNTSNDKNDSWQDFEEDFFDETLESDDQDDSDYREWSETTVKPGGKWKKIIRRYITPWWVIALIVFGAVVAVSGITVLIIYLKRKKKNKIENNTIDLIKEES